ncbi:ribosome biogenesis GTP-binding protein YihA/YsxC [Vulgatibacter incomptus]|uniref:Probable GTP-binding protein EngB n=1 Tax=Vulgatibacter incomptus TaxID=1391653 RepID=A0A0K1P8Q1_9BACT|nr:ribosome biogenesis GTP-binding protein YihA/YsxC [Vulgatibacter incomptus]AKU89786.1 GTP-binding protein EngB [Vulgatibacter incomptus]
MKIVDAEFVKSAVEPETWPPAERPEIAFVGRSNVGKSSMLNRLSGRKALARVSNTPGRTRLLNFFDLTIERGASREILRICDLPGYGFAKVSKTERANWSQMIGAYLEEREALKAVVVIIDVRIGPTDDDLEMLRWLDAEGRRSIVVATKLDKLPKAKRAGRLRQIEVQLQMTARSLLGFSSEEGLGRDELLGRILEAAHAD